MTTEQPTPSGRHIVIYTDGSCLGNPGPGGWAALLQSLDGVRCLRQKVLSGFAPGTTNNRMELTGAVEGLKAIRSGNPIFVRSDSKYLVEGASIWLERWKASGWVKADRKPIANQDLWEELEELQRSKRVNWEWVRGHAGNPLNEEADRLATAAARSVF